MAKIFPIRNYNPTKNVMLTASIPNDAPPVDYEATREAAQAIEAARRERAFMRSVERKIRRECRKPETIKRGGFIKIGEGVFTYYGCDVLAPTPLIDELLERKTGLLYRKLDLIRPFVNPDNSYRCVACERFMNQISKRWPALVIISNPKPPSKKRPLGPVGMCAECFKEKDIAEVFMSVYVMMADPSLDLFDGLKEEGEDAFANWVTRIRKALDSGSEHLLHDCEASS